MALTRDTAGELIAMRLTNREDGPNRDERFHFARHAAEMSIASISDPNLIAIVDGQDVIRVQQIGSRDVVRARDG